jgi:hypothetical protein
MAAVHDEWGRRSVTIVNDKNGRGSLVQNFPPRNKKCMKEWEYHERVVKMSSSRGNNKQTTAVADAIAGVVGSVISTIVFYPVDVWKTSRQTQTTTATTADSYNEGEGGGCATTTAETKIPTTEIVKHDNDDNINRRLLLLLRWRDNLLSFLKLQRQSVLSRFVI